MAGDEPGDRRVAVPLGPSELLADVRVLDLTHFLAGPYCTMLLGDLGATVVKVERPGTGEAGRARGPVAVGPSGDEVPTGFVGPNRNKRSITIDLKQPAGVQLLLRLLPTFDLVVENFSAGTLDRLGLGYETLSQHHPGVVLLSISGYGQPGTTPYADDPSYGPIAEALSGFTSRTGGPGSRPVFTGMPTADIVAGVYGAFGAVAAVAGSRRTGRGCHVDVAQFDCLIALMERLLLFLDVQGIEVGPGEQRMWLPTGVLTTSDGYVMYAAVSEPFFRRLAELIGHPELPDDPRLSTARQREENLTGVFQPLIEAWASTRSRREVVHALRSAGIPVAPVQGIAEVLEDPNVDARQMYVEVDHDGHGPVPYIGNPVKVSGHMRPRLASAPRLGDATGELLRELVGATDEEIAGWRQAGVI